MIFDNLITFAGSRFKAFVVKNMNNSSGISEEALFFENGSSDRYGGSGTTEHVRKELMGHNEGMGISAVRA
jgi:hypothetical protein